MRTGKNVAGFAAAALLVSAADISAQGFSVTGGAHINPDQFQVAVMYDFAPLTDRVRFRPSGGLGIGNDATLVTGNFDAIYEFKQRRRSPWTFYVGGGPAINHYRLELYNETEAGATMLAGLAHGGRWFSEFRVGFFDSPEFTAGVGYRLKAKRQTRDSRRGTR